jgi:ABC-type antimicrobial peptide transport system permease subunit
MLHGVPANDGTALLGAVGVMFLVALAASALRAARLDPMRILRKD